MFICIGRPSKSDVKNYNNKASDICNSKSDKTNTIYKMLCIGMYVYTYTLCVCWILFVTYDILLANKKWLKEIMRFWFTF